MLSNQPRISMTTLSRQQTSRPTVLERNTELFWAIEGKQKMKSRVQMYNIRMLWKVLNFKKGSMIEQISNKGQHVTYIIHVSNCYFSYLGASYILVKHYFSFTQKFSTEMKKRFASKSCKVSS